MKEFSNEYREEMRQAVSLQSEQTYRNSFNIKLNLPENLQLLDKISWNFFWSWQPDGVELFRELDPALWEKCEQNPRLFLRNIKQLRLWQKSTDREYVAKIEKFNAKLEQYAAQKPQDFGKISTENPVAYFCAEYGVHNSLPNYSGGLGILAGDHLKSASDLNIPLVAVGLLYRYGYFRQKIGHDGWQQEKYNDVFESELLNACDGRKRRTDSHDRSHSRTRSSSAGLEGANRQNSALSARHERSAKHRS